MFFGGLLRFARINNGKESLDSGKTFKCRYALVFIAAVFLSFSLIGLVFSTGTVPEIHQNSTWCWIISDSNTAPGTTCSSSDIAALEEGNAGTISMDTKGGDPIHFNSSHDNSSLIYFESLNDVEICINFSAYTVDNPTCLFRYLEKNSTGECWHTLPATAFGYSCPPATGVLHCYDIGPEPGGHDNISNRDEAENVTFYLYDVDTAGGPEYVEIDTLFINISYTQQDMPPAITIIQPWNKTYDNNTISFNITANEQLNWSAVQIGNTNHTLANQSGQWSYLNNTLSDGTYQAIFWYNDTAGLMNTTSIWFTIFTLPPSIDFVSPTPPDETCQKQGYFEVNVSIDDSFLDEVIYNWNGTNYTLYNDSLLLLMNFDNISALGENDTHVVDVSGNDNNGAVSGDGDEVNITGGKYGGAFEFDGVDDYVSISDDVIFNFTNTSNFTISVWFKANNAGSWDEILAKRDSAPHQDSPGYVFDVNSNNFYATISDGGGNFGTDTVQGSTTFTSGKWEHAVMVYYGNNSLELFFNGVSVDTGTQGAGLGDITNSRPLVLGAGSSGGNCWNGTLDELRIWNRTLSADEIYQQYVSNLNKYDKDKWLLYVNQSLNATDGLPDGTYTYQAYASNDYDKLNETGKRTITVDNILPQITVYQPWNKTYYNNTINFNITGNEQLNWSAVQIGNTNHTLTNRSGEWSYLNNTLSYNTTYQAIFWFNDTAGNMNTTSIWFTIGIPTPKIGFVLPTPPNETHQKQGYFEVNISINDSLPDEMIYNWNGTNFTLMNGSLVLMMNLDNVSVLGENDTHAVDLSGYGNDGSVVGASVKTTGCKHGNCFDFDGVNDHINLGNDDSLNTFFDSMSVEAWVNVKGNSADGYHLIVSKEQWNDPPAVDDSFVLNIEDDTFIPSFGIYSGNDAHYVSSSVVPLDTWVYIVGTYGTDGLKLYIDGKEADSGSFQGNIDTSTIDTWIGASSAGKDYFNGSIDEVRIWNISLTEDDIYQHYISNLKKYDNEKWLLYVNQSLNATDGLPDGTSTYEAYASNDYGKFNQTGRRTIIIDTILPTITIIQPWNLTYKNNSVEFNITGSEALEWAAIQLLSTNHTMTNKSGQWQYFNNSLGDGVYEARFWFNDSATHMNTDSIWFTVGASMPNISFVDPTPPNATSQSETSVEINASIMDNDLYNVTYNWDGTNYTIYNHSLVLMMNFDNVSALGENDTHVVDLSGHGNNGTVHGDQDEVNMTGGKYAGALEFDGADDFIITKTSYFNQSIGTFTAWFKPKNAGNDDKNYTFLSVPSEISNDDKGLVLLMHYNNYSTYGENDTHVYDFSGNGNNGTPVNEAHLNMTDYKFGGGAFQFDGIDDYFSIADADLSSDFPCKNGNGDCNLTISLWVKANSYDVDFVCKFEHSWCFWCTSGGYLREQHSSTQSSAILPIGEWTHLVMTHNGTYVTIYMNGKAIAGNANINGFPDSADPLMIGSSGGDDDYNGLMDEVAIWDRGLTAEEVRDIYLGGLSLHKDSDNNLRFHVGNETLMTSTSGWDANVWHHVAGSFDGNSAWLYTDGLQRDSVSSFTPPMNIFDYSFFGNDEYNHTGLNGSIDEIRIWNSYLTADNVYQQYASNLNKYDTNKWLIYVNQSLNATDGLPDGTYTYQAFAENMYYNQNQTDQMTITIDTIAPEGIYLISPTLQNNSITKNSYLEINVSFNETNPDTCLLEFDNGSIANYTMDMTKTGNGGYCFFNATGQEDGEWNYSVWINDSAGNWGSNGTWFITVDAVYILIELAQPPDPKNVAQNTTFLVNATVTCMGGFCGNITGTVRYNGSAEYPDTGISTTKGDQPFFITDSPNPQNCSQNPLSEGEWCNITWTVNATGDIGSRYDIGVLLESNMSSVSENTTANHTLKTVSCLIDMTLQWEVIGFDDVYPGDIVPAKGNDGMDYNTTVESTTTCDVSLYIMSTNFTHNESEHTIYAQNITFNNVSNDYSSGYNFTGGWDILGSSVSPGNNATTYFWLNAPWGLAFGPYTGNVTIKAVETGVLP